MSLKKYALFLISTVVLLGACTISEPSVSLETEHDCDDTHCDVQIEIRNFGNDTFDLEYEISAFKNLDSSPSTLVGQIAGSYSILGGKTITLAKQFQVSEKPTTVTTSTEATRRD
jgi:hypothetical protein